MIVHGGKQICGVAVGTPFASMKDLLYHAVVQKR